MMIRIAREADKKIWDDYVKSHPDGLGYHLFAWRRAIETAYGFTGHYLLAEQAGRVRGVFPLIAFKPAFQDLRLVSLPYCDVGGILADTEPIRKALLEQAGEMASGMGAAQLEVRFGKDQGIGSGPLSKVRMVLDLCGSSENLMTGFKAKLRSQVKKPLKDGLSATVGGLQLLDPFYRVLAENMRELGSPVHSRNWFASIIEEFAECCRVCLVFSPDGDVLAAGMILFAGKTVSVPWASSLRRFNRLNPNMLLYWTLLSFAADNNFERFDFGRSTPGSGTYRFKEQWGARPEKTFWIDLGTDGQVLPRGSESQGFRHLAEAVWQRMPAFFCNKVGPLVRRQISL